MSFVIDIDKIRGCLYAGALGDSLGYPVEFRKVGENIENFLGNKPNISRFSDDTQMTLFTTEGIIYSRNKDSLICNILSAYKYWYGTQDILPRHNYSYASELFEEERLHSKRAPGNTCLRSLRTPYDKVDNNSVGCGGVMRVAPIGLVLKHDDAYRYGCEAAYLTHQGEMGYVPAGILAAIISFIMEGNNIDDACKKSVKLSKNDEIIDKYKEIIRLVNSDLDDISCIKQLGEGWVGDEALYISMFCALRYYKKEKTDKENFYNAIKAAVTHNGDSDSTGSICGNIVGTYYGMKNFPVNKKDIECNDIIENLCVNLVLSREKFIN